MTRWLAIAAFCAVMSWGGWAHAIEGLTGSTWGTVIHNFNDDRFQTLGNLSQGIDWFERSGYRLNTYSALRWRYQAHEGTFFNAWGPALGIAVKKSGVRLGAEYYWEVKQDPGRNHDGRALIFADWYYDWDLLKVFK